MQIECERCGSSINVSQKKYQKRKVFTKSAKMVICPDCGKKTFFSILEKYNKYIS